MNIDFLEKIENVYLRRPLIVVVGILLLIAGIGVIIVEFIRDSVVGVYNYLIDYWPKVVEAGRVWLKELKYFW